MDAVHNWWCYPISVKSLSSSAAIEVGMIPVCLHASLQTGEMRAGNPWRDIKLMGSWGESRWHRKEFKKQQQQQQQKQTKK